MRYFLRLNKEERCCLCDIMIIDRYTMGSITMANEYIGAIDYEYDLLTGETVHEFDDHELYTKWMLLLKQ